PPSEEKYDFIIVGSGSAGSVVANRLSEVGQWKVLLLEAGENPTFLSDIPVLAPLFQFTNYNWGYLMEKQENFCLGLTNQRMHWPRGKVLGGTSVINYMIHIRGNKHDYDRWEAMGNPGWSYKDVLPYFLKSESANVRIHDAGYHNTNGYLSVQDIPYRTESVHAFVRAAQEVGYRYVDYNGENQMGVSYVQATERDGLRCSAEKAFLRPARSRSNLRILTKARVTKVLIDPSTKKAYGVEYIRNRKHHIARASKEVILSAGAFNSPQLLMLSGVGPKDHLQELGIPVLQNLPVGQKLYDHLTFLGLVFTVNQSIVLKQSVIEEPQSFLQLLLGGSGPLTSLGGVEGLAYFKTNVTYYPENYPDMELLFIGGGLQTDGGLYYRKMFRVSDEVYNAVWKPIEKRFAWSNPFHWPKLYGKFLTDPEGRDLKAFIAAIREVQRIARAPAFKKYGTEQLKTPIPGCEHHVFDTDEYWECAIRHVSATLHHQISTCKMGPPSDPEAVVDNRLRVYGIHNLRVIDTSIMPSPVSAHVNVPAYMIGERASAFIQEDWAKDQLIDPKYIRRSPVFT
ncbi:hypothetical protein ILUMI_02911, partial [Ignelater luminosus]